MNRSGIYDFPFQLKGFIWTEKSLASVFAYAPTFEEQSDAREYGGGFLYERYPANALALGVQGLSGWEDNFDRFRARALDFRHRKILRRELARVIGGHDQGD